MTKRSLRLLWTGILLLMAAASFQAYAQLPDPERFERDIQRFERDDERNPPPENAIVLTGSSSIARWNDQAEEALAPLTVIPRGFGGSIMNDVLHYVDRVIIAYRPRAVVIYEGDNDTSPGTMIPLAMITQQLQQIIDRIHRELPETRVYVLSVKPSPIRESVWERAQLLNEHYRKLADADPRVHYVDVATPLLNEDGSMNRGYYVRDMLHLNGSGNEIWGTTIKAALMPLEARYE
ncbi:MAG TPA: GDSL-type esterase/lipase family protein [Gammaproteobacteria bacterium]